MENVDAIAMLILIVILYFIYKSVEAMFLAIKEEISYEEAVERIKQKDETSDQEQANEPNMLDSNTSYFQALVQNSKNIFRLLVFTVKLMFFGFLLPIFLVIYALNKTNYLTQKVQ